MMRNRRAATRFPGWLACGVSLMAFVVAVATGLGAPRNQGGEKVAGAVKGQRGSQDESAEIKKLIAKYAAAVDTEPVDIALASQVWSNSADVSFIQACP